jgi:diadenosine tetraphosphate (Ap4A) HIT family hydrolase
MLRDLTEVHLMKRVNVVPADMEAYIKERRTAPCFICEIVNGEPRRDTHHIVHENESMIVFFSAMPTQYGHILVCPKRHVEKIFADLSREAYEELQRVVWAVGRAIQEVLGPERIYVASFGSQQMNRHVHFHVVPLPAGVPVREQQMAAMMPEVIGLVHLEEGEWEALTEQVREALLRHI